MFFRTSVQAEVFLLQFIERIIAWQSEGGRHAYFLNRDSDRACAHRSVLGWGYTLSGVLDSAGELL